MFVKSIFVLLSVVQIGLSIRCYECNSANNSMCLDPHLYDQETLSRFLRVTDCQQGILLIEAPAGHFFCRKIWQTILRKHYEPEVRVTRGCGWKRFSRPCYKADNEDHLETVCQCDTDLCNHAGFARLQVPALLAAICLKMLML